QRHVEAKTQGPRTDGSAGASPKGATQRMDAGGNAPKGEGPKMPEQSPRAATMAPGPGGPPVTGPGEGGSAGKAPRTGELSDVEHTNALREMQQLERSGNAYDANGKPTPRYAEQLDQIQRHVE